MIDQVHPSREAWLTAAYLGLQPTFARVNRPIIVPVRLTVGFPSSSALSASKKRVGECWDKSASSDGHAEILISPLIDDEMEVLSVVAHELGHAVLGAKVGHKRPFGDLMLAIGLEGKAVATVPGVVFKRDQAQLLEDLGAFPHGRLIPQPREDGAKKVKLLRVECRQCGYTARVIDRWLRSSGAPLCPVDKVPLVEK